ncbi:helix-turn-helix domain-containing protein [Paucilactobacillus sp. N302-9]
MDKQIKNLIDNRSVRITSENFMDAKTAAEIWGMNDTYVRTAIKQNPDKWPNGSYRKFGTTLVVTSLGMEAVTGKADPRLFVLIPRIGHDLTNTKKDKIIKAARSIAGHNLKESGTGTLSDYLPQAVKEYTEKEVSELKSIREDKEHFTIVNTEIGAIKVNIDGEDILIRNGGIDGETRIAILDDLSTADFKKKYPNGPSLEVKEEQRISGENIQIQGFEQSFTGEYQAYSLDEWSLTGSFPERGSVYFVKIGAYK